MKMLEKLTGEFAAIDEYLKAVREILQDGHMPDMTGLDARVSDLCAALEQAKPELQQQCLPKLDKLLKRLDVCETEIRAFRASRQKAGPHD
ncbi:MAG: hypothetical protein P4M15_09800 [Alphaproteobacteria bacterium]|nr:hypothetical protein [Alphaproteobacteria bacterium]